MVDYLSFAGERSSAYHVYISGEKTFGSSSRSYETYSVPGRNGDLHVDQGRFENYQQDYSAFIRSGFREWISMWANHLLYHTGYQRLEDSYHPDEFRLARFMGGIDPATGTLNRSGSFTLSFDCKPQRFLKSGENLQIVTSGQYLSNPELMDALPLIRVFGYGTLTIGEYTIEILEHSYEYMDIDCELQDAYSGAANLNSSVEIAEFPKIPAAGAVVSFDDTITAVRIAPRWWRL